MYSVSCIASGLPIQAGDRVMAMLVTHADYEDSWPCHPHGTWSPRTPPVAATYDGAGMLEEIEDTPLVELWTRLLDIDAVEVDDKYEPVKHGAGLPSYLSAAQSRALRVRHQWADRCSFRREHDVGLAMVRHDVWQRLLAMPPPRYRGLGDAESFVRDELEMRRAAIGLSNGGAPWMALNNLYLEREDAVHSCLVMDCDTCSCPGHVAWSDHYRAWIEDARAPDWSSTADAVGRRFAEAVYVYHQFRRLDLAFRPSFYAQQDPDWEARILWAELVKASADASLAEETST